MRNHAKLMTSKSPNVGVSPVLRFPLLFERLPNLSAMACHVFRGINWNPVLASQRHNSLYGQKMFHGWQEWHPHPKWNVNLLHLRSNNFTSRLQSTNIFVLAFRCRSSIWATSRVTHFQTLFLHVPFLLLLYHFVLLCYLLLCLVFAWLFLAFSFASNRSMNRIYDDIVVNLTCFNIPRRW